MKILRVVKVVVSSLGLYIATFSMESQTLELQETVIFAGSKSSLPNLSVNPLGSGSGVKLTGQIMRLPGSDGGASSNSSYQVAETGLQVFAPPTPGSTSEHLPASNVKVRYWMRDIPNIKREALSDNNGEYEVDLTNGVWMGAVCAKEGSGVDYSPRFWQLRIQNNTVTELQAVDSPAQLASVSPVQASAGDTVTVSGSGFACSGALLLRDLAPITTLSLWGEINYSSAEVRIEEFISRDDRQLVFIMPDLQSSLPSEQQGSLASVVSRISYQSGEGNSNTIRLTQYVTEISSSAVSTTVITMTTMDGGDGNGDSGTSTSTSTSTSTGMTNHEQELVKKANKAFSVKTAKGGVL